MRLTIPAGFDTADYYFNHVRGVSNSRLNEIERWMQGNLDFQFPAGAARTGNLVDAILTQPESIFQDASPEELRNARKIAANVNLHPLAKMMVEKAEPQAVHTNQICGIETKSMLDLELPRVKAGGDLKTTAATSQAAFEKAIERFRYDRQAVFYMLNAELNTFVLIGLPKTRKDVFLWILKRSDPRFIEIQKEIEQIIYYHQLTP